jgi:hypothetical protein
MGNLLGAINGGSAFAGLKKSNSDKINTSPSPGSESAKGKPPAAGLLSAIQMGTANLKTRDGSDSPSSPSPKSPGGGMSMMDQINAKKGALKPAKSPAITDSKGSAAKAANSPAEPSGGGGFNTNMLMAKANSAAKKEPKDDDDDDWSDDDAAPNPQRRSAAPPLADPPKSSTPAPVITKAPTPALAPTPPTATTPSPKMERPSPASVPPPSASTPPTPAPTTTPSKPDRSPAMQRQTSNNPPETRSSSPAPPMSWQEKNRLAKKEAEKLKAERQSKGPVAASQPARNNSHNNNNSDGEIAALKIQVSDLENQLSAERRSVQSLKDENQVLKDRVSEAEGPNAKRRDSAAFKNLMDLKGGGDEELRIVREELRDAKSTIDQMKASAKQSSYSGPDPSGSVSSERGLNEMAEMSNMRKQLTQARADKEKALKIVVKIIGKKKMAAHLKEHEHSGDALASLIGKFSGRGFDIGDEEMGSPISPRGGSPRMNKSMGSPRNKTPGSGQQSEYKRNRMDDYHRSNGISY